MGLVLLRCPACQKLMQADISQQSRMGQFSIQCFCGNSYIFNPAQTTAHYCTGCAQTMVLHQTENPSAPCLLCGYQEDRSVALRFRCDACGSRSISPDGNPVMNCMICGAQTTPMAVYGATNGQPYLPQQRRRRSERLPAASEPAQSNYAQPQPDHTQPAADYAQPQQSNTQPAADYAQPQQSYSQPEANYAQPEPESTQLSNSFAQPEPEFAPSEPEVIVADAEFQPFFSADQYGAPNAVGSVEDNVLMEMNDLAAKMQVNSSKAMLDGGQELLRSRPSLLERGHQHLVKEQEIAENRERVVKRLVEEANTELNKRHQQEIHRLHPWIEQLTEEEQSRYLNEIKACEERRVKTNPVNVVNKWVKWFINGFFAFWYWEIWSEYTFRDVSIIPVIFFVALVYFAWKGCRKLTGGIANFILGIGKGRWGADKRYQDELKRVQQEHKEKDAYLDEEWRIARTRSEWEKPGQHLPEIAEMIRIVSAVEAELVEKLKRNVETLDADDAKLLAQEDAELTRFVKAWDEELLRDSRTYMEALNAMYANQGRARGPVYWLQSVIAGEEGAIARAPRGVTHLHTELTFTITVRSEGISYVISNGERSEEPFIFRNVGMRDLNDQHMLESFTFALYGTVFKALEAELAQAHYDDQYSLTLTEGLWDGFVLKYEGLLRA